MKHRIRAAAIIMNGDKILLVKHVHPETGYGWWVPPGGGLEESDGSVFDCAKREAFEETNLKIEIFKILYLREFISEEFQSINLEIFTLADSFSGDVSIKNIEGHGLDEQYIKDAKWFSKEDLKDMVVFPEILKNEFWSDRAAGFPAIKYLGRQGK